MFNDIFGREVHIGDLVIAELVNYAFYLTPNLLSVVTGDNCVVPYFDIHKSADKLQSYYFKNCILIEEPSAEQLKIKNKILNYIDSVRHNNVVSKTINKNYSPIFILPTKNPKYTDILGDELNSGDLVLVNNKGIGLDKVNVGLYTGIEKVAVFNEYGKIEVITAKVLMKIPDKSQKVLDFYAILSKHYNKYLIARADNIKTKQELKIKKHVRGSVLIDKDGMYWVCLGKGKFICYRNSELFIDLSGMLYISLCDVTNDILDLDEYFNEYLEYLPASVVATKAQSRRFRYTKDCKVVTLQGLDNEGNFQYVLDGYTIRIKVEMCK